MTKKNEKVEHDIISAQNARHNTDVLMSDQGNCDVVMQRTLPKHEDHMSTKKLDYMLIQNR